MKTLTIIPARAESLRLPNKNTRLLGNLPLIEHSMKYALRNKAVVGDIVITTDDEQIKKLAIPYDLRVIHRPEELASDTATTASVMTHALEEMEKEYDWVILLQPTNPLRPMNLLSDAFAKAKQLQVDSLMTVTRSYHKLGKITEERFQPFNYKMGQRTQDLAPLYYENGLLYITKASLIKKGIILGEHNYPYIVEHPYASVDIDEEIDFKFAQFILTQYPNE